MTPRVDIFFKIFCAKKFSITQRSFWGHFQKTYISTSVLPNFGQRLPKIQSRDINFCQFYDPPKPGVDRAEYDFSGSKIAKNCLKTPKIDSMCLQNGRKLCPINFCDISEPPNWGKRLNLTSLRSKLPKITQKGQNEALHPQKWNLINFCH